MAAAGNTGDSSSLTAFEKIPVRVYADADHAAEAIAQEIAATIRAKAAASQRCILGLATGSTFTRVYEQLVRMHRQDGLSFRNVVTFNLDEYYQLRPEELQSCRRFMDELLFRHIDIAPADVHIPDGMTPVDQVAAYCRAYEEAIRQAGGIDLQLLGIGRTGHIGFNEPGSARDSRTRLIWLDKMTRTDAAADFFGIENVPSRAITMGVGTILEARRIILAAFGEGKAAIIAQAVEGPVTPAVAASFLQEHPNAQVVLDAAAAAGLMRFRCPWLLGRVAWTPRLIRKAVIWLSGRVGKPILKLTDEDYNEQGLQDLLADHGPAYDINLAVFRAMQATITGWPGGHRPAASAPADEPFPKRILVFSPHPDDDVICMGGTIIRLVDHGHDVHVAYQTSGGIAVFDADAIRFADFAVAFNREFGIDHRRSVELERHIEEFLKNKKPGQVDSQEVQRIKAMIRRGEARAAGRACGIPLDNIHFLDMPFYDTGRVLKKTLGDADVDILVRLLEEIQPHQVYAAGDLSDPHGTHRTCLAAVLRAFERLKDRPWFRRCAVWLYRGAWQEWEPHEIDMAVPLSPQELLRKRMAIFKHQSQKDRALFPGPDQREFWQRAEARNRQTAQTYDKLGLAEYEAIEAFVRWPLEENCGRSDGH